MLFNSLDFLIFFPIVAALFFLLQQLRMRQYLLLAASYYFYMCWKPEYLVLILISTLIDFFAALQMAQAKRAAYRKLYLILSLCGNLGILFFFKYANFFGESLHLALQQFDIFYEMPFFDILLPVGISFYTFQSLSYSIDVYRGEKQPERDFVTFALYVAFFPQLVAGPIERSTRLLPQFRTSVRFEPARVISGLRLMLWGFFKKLVIADRLALYVNEVYNDPGDYFGLTLLVATYFFAIQIYCDFSGYSDIAIGAARILGYDLMKNFRQPYFSHSIAEFWRRWHISLSTWFRDYLYIPLGGNRVTRPRWLWNLMIVFVVSGLWHGANWTFVFWGFLHGFYLVFSISTHSLRQRLVRMLRLDAWPRLHRGLQWAITLHLVLFAWIFFRANSLDDAILILQQLTVIEFSVQELLRINVEIGWGELGLAFASIVLLLMVDWLDSRQQIQPVVFARPRALRWIAYYALLLGILFFGVYNHTEFIYFQF